MQAAPPPSHAHPLWPLRICGKDLPGGAPAVCAARAYPFPLAAAAYMLASAGLLLSISATITTASVDGDWTLHKMVAAAESKGAVCLDGSPAAYYLRQPSIAPPAGSTPWVVFMEGGGWCLESSCLSRAGTDLGSSTKYPAQPGAMEGGGLYAEFATATVVYMKYCDGGSFTGNADAPVTFPDSTQKIYYRGRRIMDALFDELLGSRGLDTATELLFAGCSAVRRNALSSQEQASSVVVFNGGKCGS